MSFKLKSLQKNVLGSNIQTQRTGYHGSNGIRRALQRLSFRGKPQEYKQEEAVKEVRQKRLSVSELLLRSTNLSMADNLFPRIDPTKYRSVQRSEDVVSSTDSMDIEEVVVSYLNNSFTPAQRPVVTGSNLTLPTEQNGPPRFVVRDEYPSRSQTNLLTPKQHEVYPTYRYSNSATSSPSITLNKTREPHVYGKRRSEANLYLIRDEALTRKAKSQNLYQANNINCQQDLSRREFFLNHFMIDTKVHSSRETHKNEQCTSSTETKRKIRFESLAKSRSAPHLYNIYPSKDKTVRGEFLGQTPPPLLKFDTDEDKKNNDMHDDYIFTEEIEVDESLNIREHVSASFKYMETAVSKSAGSTDIMFGCHLQYTEVSNHLLVFVEKRGQFLYEQLKPKRANLYAHITLLPGHNKEKRVKVVSGANTRDKHCARFQGFSRSDLSRMKLGVQLYRHRGLFRKPEPLTEFIVPLLEIDLGRKQTAWFAYTA
ncbi:hypothetical protein DPMN_139107 [Dreissena polymorpha]|uniref:Uncharacterized protein n=1 Tax=Dreissena polymorpha TaxID=45954 RepID=A0A9D4JG77_DREPO|nr:hypothetical protein DPMN_139107 [Dreissena polymorpha]